MQKIVFLTTFNTIFKTEAQNASKLSSKVGLFFLFIVVLMYDEVLEKVLFHNGLINQHVLVLKRKLTLT